MAWSMDVNRPVYKVDTINVDRFSRLEYIYVSFHRRTVSDLIDLLFSQTQTIDETCLQIWR